MEYSLTDKGQTFNSLFEEICEWGDGNREV
ncbi:winged helix-turn-helix transcriptional regulator [Aureibacillus halotolerans]